MLPNLMSDKNSSVTIKNSSVTIKNSSVTIRMVFVTTLSGWLLNIGGTYYVITTKLILCCIMSIRKDILKF